MPSLSDYCRSAPLLCGQQMAVFELWSPAENTGEQSGLATSAWSQESVDWTSGHWERQPIEDLNTMRIVWGIEISNLLFITPQKHTIKLSPLQVQIILEIQRKVFFYLPFSIAEHCSIHLQCCYLKNSWSKEDFFTLKVKSKYQFGFWFQPCFPKPPS